MLSFVGLGLYDEQSITLRGRQTVHEADRVFVEFYTSALTGTTLESLASFHATEIEPVDRETVEGNPEEILRAAEQGHAVFLVAGDPMIATTHVDLRLRAHDRGIETTIVNGVSAHTAASSLTGLQNYRFGKATTLPIEHHHTVPPSVITTIDDNRARNLHTLVYLDIRADTDEYLTADRAAATLFEALSDCLGVVIARAGSPQPRVHADRLSRLAEMSFGDPLHLLIIPGPLHAIEADALQAFANAPAALVTEALDE